MTKRQDTESPEPMQGDPEASIFREQALLEYARRGVRGDVLRTSSRRLDLVFWLCILTFALAFGAAALFRAPSSVQGPAVVFFRASGSPAIAVFFPGNLAPKLHKLRAVQFAISGYEGVRLSATVRSIGDSVIDAHDAHAAVGELRAPEGLTLPPRVIVLDADLQSRNFDSRGETFSLVNGLEGTATVELASDSLLALLLQDLH